MFKSLIGKIYPFLSIGVIEIGSIIDNLSNLFTCIIIFFQILIAVLTVAKLYKDIKYHKYKSVSQTEKTVKRKHPFLFALLQFLKSKKNV